MKTSLDINSIINSNTVSKRASNRVSYRNSNSAYRCCIACKDYRDYRVYRDYRGYRDLYKFPFKVLSKQNLLRNFIISLFISFIIFRPLSSWGSEDKNFSRHSTAYKKNSYQSQASFIFDIPVTYNTRVTSWIHYYQTKGQKWFRNWIELSTHYMPMLQRELKNNGLPQDLAYMVMIESGFKANALSSADAVGPWQFIRPTGERYGLKVNSWLDERRDWAKSTKAATRYLRDLYQEFGSWYLVAASYNMGENGLRRQIQKHKTKDFWRLAELSALPKETIDYVPKILAAMLISKAPSLYGFRNIPFHQPFEFEMAYVPGGTTITQVADALGLTHQALKEMNQELVSGAIPHYVTHHPIKVPKGAGSLVAVWVKKVRYSETYGN